LAETGHPERSNLSATETAGFSAVEH
jgi:hypothetical protein